MSVPIFYIQQLDASNVITLNEETSKHIVQVLRMKPQEQLQLTDGKGNLLTASIADDHKKKCTVQVLERKFNQKKKQEVCIAISLLKNTTRLEWFLEKATEIGVTEIVPMLCSRTEKQHFRYDRMNAILIAAMLQSQQLWLPVLREPTAFGEVVAGSTYQTKYIAHCQEGEKNAIQNSSRSAQILIGPEGDFTHSEIELALQQNYQPVTLGNTRLRTETAGVVAATLMCL